MKQFLLTIFAVSFLFTVTTAAQVCGGGTRVYEVFVKNGLNAVNPRYELFAVIPISVEDEFESTRKYLNQTFFPTEIEKIARFWVYEPLNIRTEVAERFLAGYKVENYRKEPEDERYFQENKRSGQIKFGELNFKTRELYDRPLLLKIFADNYKPVYLLSDHFGGCSKTYRVLLVDYK